ncbi:SapC family protein [Verticiella sediminum]|nr:SapC family protein [Verticiella sediminum]
MAIQVLSRQEHKNLRLKAPDQPYAFAAKRMLAGLVVPELAEVAKYMPIAFTHNKEQDQTHMVCLLGLGEDNLFVDPDGKWIGGYVPAVLRAWPFSLIRQGDKRVIGVERESPALLEGDVGTPLFLESGEPSPRLEKTIQFLQAFSDQEQVVARALAALQKAEVLVPWDLTVKRPEGSLQINGLLQIDKAAYAALSDAAFLELRRAGALPLVYAHDFSLRNVATLETLAQRRAQIEQREAPVNLDALPENLFESDDYLKF